MVRDQFKAIFYLASQITETVKGDAGNGVLAGERELLGKALEDVQGIIAALGGWAMAWPFCGPGSGCAGPVCAGFSSSSGSLGARTR